MKEYDLIVVGSGHNGLIGGCYLAKSGLKVLVLEKREILGGGATTEELTLPGFKHDACSSEHVLIFFGPVIKELELETRYGLEYYFHPVLYGVGFMDGTSIAMYKEVKKTCESIAKVSEKDADTYLSLYNKFLSIKEPFLSQSFSPPVDPSVFFGNLERVEGGKELARLAMLNPKEVLDELFEDERTKGFIYGMSGAALLNSPDEFGSGLSIFITLGLQYYGKIGKAVGGAGMLTYSLRKCLEDNGGETRVNSEVDRIIVEDGKASGVKLKDGEIIKAKKAILVNSPPHLIVKMVGKDYVGEDFSRKAENFRFGTGLFAIHLALDGEVNFNASELNGCGATIIYETLSHSLKCFNECKEGRIPWDNICLYFTNYNLGLSSRAKRAPEGKAAALLMGIPVPAFFSDGSSWHFHKMKFAEALISKLEEYAPNIRSLIIKSRIESPSDIERRIPGMVGGDIMIGRNSLEQYFFRPFPGYTHYRTSIPNLYMTGGATWPSGGISGASGYNVANIIKEDLNIR
jgi:phytoene dehydrogenase-like protein